MSLTTWISVELLLLCFLTSSSTTLEHEINVVTVKEGDDVILPCSLSSKENITSTLFDWIKDRQKNRQEVFFYNAGDHYNNGRTGQHEQFKGRVSHFPEELKYGNASIMIRNTKIEDSGNYRCIFPRLHPSQTFHIKLVVDSTLKDRSGESRGVATKPYVTLLKQTADGMLLQCKVQGAFPKPELHWQDRDGNILHAEKPKETKRGDRYDVTINITVTKTGNYRCVATQEEIKHQIYSDTHLLIPEKQMQDKSSHEAFPLVSGWFAGALTLAVVLVVIIGVMYFIIRRKKGSYQKKGSHDLPSKMPLNQQV